MCGIAGVLGSQAESKINAMVAKIQHRGPDGSGVLVDDQGRFAVGHTRLAVIDLSSRANQPMVAADGRLCIVFNGEIYNFRSIRDELCKLGAQFKTESDTEVVLKAYEVWGCDCIQRFDGMFAFGLIDLRFNNTPKIFIARDHFGIKPLFYSIKSGNFYFSSEISPILAAQTRTIEFCNTAVGDLISLGSVRTGLSFDREIRALLPGTFGLFERGTLKLRRYWDVIGATTKLRNEFSRGTPSRAGHTEEIRKLAERAVLLSAEADAPLCMLLSGGLDSGSILQILTASNRVLHLAAYTLVSDRSPDIDESSAATLLSKRFGADLHIVHLRETSIEESYLNWIKSLDQPSIDGFNLSLITERVSKSFKVALSGLGGDEIFAGYPHFRKRNTTIPAALRAIIGNSVLRANRLHSNRLTLGAIRRFCEAPERWAIARSLKGTELHALSNLEWYVSDLSEWVTLDDTQKITALELQGYLAPTLLHDADVNSMYNGVEVRPSLLNRELVEYVFSIPEVLKYSSQKNKPLLVDALNDELLKKLSSHRKRGFELPYVRWMTTELKTTFLRAFGTPIARHLFNDQFLDEQRRRLTAGYPSMVTWAAGNLLGWANFR